MVDLAEWRAVRRARDFIRSWRLSRAVARDPRWQADIAEAERRWTDFVARGCPEDELISLDELKAKYHL